jgi:hypothetical protein
MYITNKPPKHQPSIVDRAIKYIDATPPAISGNNGHNQTFKLASTLVHGFYLDGATVFSLLETYYNPKCDPQWSEEALARKVREAEKTQPNKPDGWLLRDSDKRRESPARLRREKAAIPKPDPIENIRKLIGDCRCTEDDLRDASPYKLPPLAQEKDFHLQGAILIENLFREDDLVNIVEASKQDSKGKWYPVGYGLTQSRAKWIKTLQEPLRRLEGGRWMRMNPMDGEGISDANVTAYNRYLLEFDNIGLELQRSLFAKLPLRIEALIYSGGKSYHCWVKSNAGSLEEYRKEVAAIYERMSVFGIDTSNKNPSRMSRLAGTYRGDQTQRLVYLNPEPSTRGIL